MESLVKVTFDYMKLKPVWWNSVPKICTQVGPEEMFEILSNTAIALVKGIFMEHIKKSLKLRNIKAVLGSVSSCQVNTNTFTLDVLNVEQAMN